MNKVVITGAGGLIGSYVIKELFNNGIKVVGVYRTKPKDVVPWKCVVMDLTLDNLSILNLNNQDCIIHCAAHIPKTFSDSDFSYKINKQIDENVLSICEKEKVNIIFISSTSVYGPRNNLITETDKIEINNKYSKGKIETEIEIDKIKCVKKIILRINAPYAPEQKNNTVLKLFIENALSNKPITLHGYGGRKQTFTSASDIASAILQSYLANSEIQNGIYNISGNDPISMKTLAEVVLKFIPESRSDIVFTGQIDEQESYKAIFSIEKARNYLKWEPKISIEDGILNWVKYLRR